MPDLAKARLEIAIMLRTEEGEILVPYLCDAGAPTVGVGATTYPDGRRVSMSDPPITREQSAAMLAVEVERYMGAVLDMTGGRCSTNQLIGLTSCAYNIGTAGLRGSSMIRLHLAGDYSAAARAFMLWNKVRDPRTRELRAHPALENRRRREAARYSTPDSIEHMPARPPQAAEPETSMASSTITQGGSAVAGVGAVVTATQALGPDVDAVSGLAGKVRALVVEVCGVPLDAFARWWPALLIVIGGWIVWQRWKRRREGWI